MTRYGQVKLGEVATIRGGKRLPLGADFMTEPTDHPYIRARDIGDGKIEIHEPVFLSKEVASRLGRYTVKELDICLTIVGANVGEMGVVPPGLEGANLTENAVRIVSNGKAIQSFLKYALLSNHAAKQMKVLAGGAAQPKLGIYKVETIEIPLPPTNIQERIAEILAAYDELIENNQRRIRILEEMARRLYREWFVHFRFPGHENHPRVPSPIGEIPLSWEIKQIEKLTSFLSRGISPSYDEDGDSLVINQKCIRDQRLSFDPARRQNKKVPEQKFIQYGDVLVNSTGVGTLGRVAQVLTRVNSATVDSHVTIVRPGEQVDLSFFGCSLLHLEPEFERLGVGATGQTELSRASIGGTSLICPPPALQREFGRLISPMRDAAICYATQVENLRRTRDLLLPRLLSGQIKLEVN